MITKEEFKVGDNAFRLVQPCGMLFTQGREYFLLHPYPVKSDWETLADRFVCVPNKPLYQLEEKDGLIVYPFARHVVTNGYAIDYAPNMPFICVVKLSLDLSDIELADSTEVIPNYRFMQEVNDAIREADEYDAQESLSDTELEEVIDLDPSNVPEKDIGDFIREEIEKEQWNG